MNTTNDEIDRLKCLLNTGMENIEMIERLIIVDEENRIEIGVRCSLIRKCIHEVLFSMENDFQPKEAVDNMLENLRRKHEI